MANAANTGLQAVHASLILGLLAWTLWPIALTGAALAAVRPTPR